jgi:hypothetical protein
MAFDPITAALKLGDTVINKVWPDASEAEKQKMQYMLAVYTSQADILKTEIASQHWLAANWRPIVMLVFTALVVARWFGWTAPNLAPEEYLKLWDIVQLSIGGYTIGRTAEKIAPAMLSKKD